MITTQLTHILFIDSLDKLTPKKDSSLQLALSLKELGRQVYLLFEKDFYFDNTGDGKLLVHDFRGNFYEDGCYLKHFELTKAQWFQLSEKTILHMRIDPPFDSRYLRYLWMLEAVQNKYQVKVINEPKAIAAHNEKMVCYQQENSAHTFVGSSEEGFKAFYSQLKAKEDYSGLILKPLDLFQGIGVEKIDVEASDEEVFEKFNEKLKVYRGPVVAQPFLKEVYSGELRSIFFNSREMGTIIKTPPEGQYLANIAQGAKFEKVELSPKVHEECAKMSSYFANIGVPWIAFDILGETIQEANLTCPGLLVEVSKAAGKNLAFDLVAEMESYLSF